ncbi:MAG: MBL fold metallo-hydrolase [Clostridia bacterium]
MVKERTGYFPGSVNIGIVRGESGAILIDSGLDTQTAKKIKKGLDEIGLKLSAIIQTHAHADHFGGNSYLLTQFPEVQVYAPELEEAVIRYPILEPIYLMMGAAPLAELKNKFLLAEASRVDHLLPSSGTVTVDGVEMLILPLPGHSWNQVGIVVDQICYAADSFFGVETLKKHKLPFLVDAHETLLSLTRLLETRFEGYLPGHGSFERSIEEVVKQNIHCHRTLMDTIVHMLEAEELTMEQGLAKLCSQMEMNVDNVTSYVLYRTAYMGYLVGLLREERIAYRFSDNCLLWSSLA